MRRNRSLPDTGAEGNDTAEDAERNDEPRHGRNQPVCRLEAIPPVELLLPGTFLARPQNRVLLGKWGRGRCVGHLNAPPDEPAHLFFDQEELLQRRTQLAVLRIAPT